MISNTVSSTETVRNVFVIDNKGIVRTVLVYPMSIGRCIPEILRIVESLQISDYNEAFLPANWIPGQPVMITSPKTCEQLQERAKTIKKEKNGMSWYLSFKNSECDKKFDETKIKEIENKNMEKN